MAFASRSTWRVALSYETPLASTLDDEIKRILLSGQAAEATEAREKGEWRIRDHETHVQFNTA